MVDDDDVTALAPDGGDDDGVARCDDDGGQHEHECSHGTHVHPPLPRLRQLYPALRPSCTHQHMTQTKRLPQITTYIKLRRVNDLRYFTERLGTLKRGARNFVEILGNLKKG